MWLSVTKDSDGKSWNQTERTKNQALLDLLRFTNYSPALSPAAALRHTLLCDVATRANRHFQTHDALLCFRELQTNTESGQGVPAWEHQKRISLQVSPPPLGSVRRSPGVQLSASLASSTLVLYLVQYLGLPYLTALPWAQTHSAVGRGWMRVCCVNWTARGGRFRGRLHAGWAALASASELALPPQTGVLHPHLLHRVLHRPAQPASVKKHNMGELLCDLRNKGNKIIKLRLFVSYVKPEDTHDANYVAPSNLHSGTLAHR